MFVEYLWYAFAGVLGGVLGGMGMGGGTLLIPLLGIFYDVSQHAAQAINLISFIPMAAAALFVHIKNKRVDFHGVLYVILSGVCTCVIGAYIARAVPGAVLRKCFGGFLLLLSAFQLVTGLKKQK